jgi:hypothetical protein
MSGKRSTFNTQRPVTVDRAVSLRDAKHLRLCHHFSIERRSARSTLAAEQHLLRLARAQLLNETENDSCSLRAISAKLAISYLLAHARRSLRGESAQK